MSTAASGSAAAAGTAGSSSESGGPPYTQAHIDDKITADLEMVENKIAQCEGLMIGNDFEMLLATVGFLEACAPRMIELVEAAAQGALSEHVLVRCLEVNDKLQKLLDDVDRNPPGEGAAFAAAASSDADLLSPPTGAPPSSTSEAPAIGKTRSEDEFDSFFNDRHETK
jgi:hypothetical protein